MANTPTTYYNLNKPAIGDSGWGAILNANFDGIDTAIHLVSTAVASLVTSTALKADIASPVFTGVPKAPQGAFLKADRGSVNSATSFDLGTAYHRLTCSGSFTATLLTTNLTTATSGYAVGILLDITMGGSFTITWPGAVKWTGGAAPTLTSGQRFLIALITADLGVTYLGSANTGYA